jgi:hypothetical protein
VRRVRHCAESRQVGALLAPCPAKDIGVSPGGTGSQRVMLGSNAGPFTGPDGIAWDAATL